MHPFGAIKYVISGNMYQCQSVSVCRVSQNADRFVIDLPGSFFALRRLGAVHVCVSRGVDNYFDAGPVKVFDALIVGYIKLRNVRGAGLGILSLQGPAQLAIPACNKNLGIVHQSSIGLISDNLGRPRSRSDTVAFPMPMGQSMPMAGSAIFMNG